MRIREDQRKPLRKSGFRLAFIQKSLGLVPSSEDSSKISGKILVTANFRAKFGTENYCDRNREERIRSMQLGGITANLRCEVESTEHLLAWPPLQSLAVKKKMC